VALEASVEMIATNEERSTQDLLDRLEWLHKQRTKARSRTEIWSRRSNLMTAEIVSVERLLVTRGIVDSRIMLAQHILDLIADGRTNPEIADALGYGIDYIKQQVDDLLGEAGVSSRTALVSHHFRTGRLK
jgi:DNA-binding CsgD family transcriptional regulator